MPKIVILHSHEHGFEAQHGTACQKPGRARFTLEAFYTVSRMKTLHNCNYGNL